MTLDEVLAVAELVERAAKRYNEQTAVYEHRISDHQAGFLARTEADRVVIEGLRADLAAVQAVVKEQSDAAKDAGELLGWTSNESAFQAAQRVVKERDALRAEIERLKSLSPKYKVGDKLESYNRLVYDCIADGAEYPVGYSEDELREVASHDTPAGKEAAKAASKVRPADSACNCHNNPPCSHCTWYADRGLDDPAEAVIRDYRSGDSEVAITGLFDDTKITVRREPDQDLGSRIVIRDANAMGEANIYLTEFGARQMAAALVGLCDVRKVTQ